jgi:hypothetical protein
VRFGAENAPALSGTTLAFLMVMPQLRPRVLSRASSAVLASAVMAFGAGCAAPVYAGPAYVEGAPVVAGPAQDYGEVVYVDAPPVADIEAYPTIYYGGVSVYYVSGRWYQRGPRGWGYYRQEPPELGRQRQEHWQRDHDQRWADQPGPEHQRQEERAPQSPATRGVTEPQPPDRRAPPTEPRRENVPAPPAPQAQPHRERAPAPPAPTAQPHHRDEAPSPHPDAKGRPPVEPAPVHPPQHQPEHQPEHQHP